MPSTSTITWVKVAPRMLMSPCAPKALRDCTSMPGMYWSSSSREVKTIFWRLCPLITEILRYCFGTGVSGMRVVRMRMVSRLARFCAVVSAERQGQEA
ncbi:MAG: hypothetical protein H6559_36015 [Lewinellaceae bacterium]|nr:hypothetical protein [Lewinellaceae bacterium]